MLNMDMINEEIKALEECNTSYAVCEKLAMLYIIRDHYKGGNGQSDMMRAVGSDMPKMIS